MLSKCTRKKTVDIKTKFHTISTEHYFDVHIESLFDESLGDGRLLNWADSVAIFDSKEKVL